MSKNRSIRFNSNPASLLHSHNQHKNISKPKSFFHQKSTRSILLPSTGRVKTDVNLSQVKREQIYNKNITYFRQSIKMNDTTLPFLSSLRYIHLKTQQSTPSAPFQAAFKITMSKLTRKNVSDIQSNPKRLSKAFYRWHQKSGLHIKESVEYECALRTYKPSLKGFNPQQRFDNQIRPMKYKDVQEKKYKKNEIICQRQSKLFTIQ